MTCSVAGCSSGKTLVKGLCSTHYQRLQRLGSTDLPERQRVSCPEPNCGRPLVNARWCRMHQRRMDAHGDLGKPVNAPLTVGETQYRTGGYVYIYDPEHPNASKRGYVSGHIRAMTASLGRAMLKGESVHHKNGVRDDNRLDNLELWVTSQPSGQRPADLVAWATEILRTYGNLDEGNASSIEGRAK